MNTKDTDYSHTNALLPTSSEFRTPSVRRVNSHQLLDGKKELLIEHSGEDYRLRITSKGKLILTK